MSRTATFANTTTTAFGPLDTTTALRPARLLCPECVRQGESAGWLVPCAVGHADFHHCRGCGGAWFQDKGVEDALRAARQGQWPAPAAAPEIAATESGWACPCCQGLLVAVNDCRGSGARVRRCLVCYGGWIQYSDLLKAMDSSPDLLSRVGRFVRRLLR